MNQMKRSYVVLASIMFLLGASVVFFSMILPTADKIQQLRGQRRGLQEVLQEERASVAAIENLMEQYVSIPDLQESLSLSLPTEEEVPNIVNQLQGMAKLSGVSIDSVSLQRRPIEPSRSGDLLTPVGILEITMNVRSPYESLKLYLEDIETNIRIMDVQSVRVEGGAGQDILSYSIVVHTYYQR